MLSMTEPPPSPPECLPNLRHFLSPRLQTLLAADPDPLLSPDLRSQPVYRSLAMPFRTRYSVLRPRGQNRRSKHSTSLARMATT